MSNNVRTVLIHAQEVKKEKQTFPVFSTEINDTWYKVKFTKDCENSPKTKGLYDLTFNFDDCSVEKGKHYINRNGEDRVSSDTIWIRKITAIRKYTDDELAEANRIKMSTIFGE